VGLLCECVQENMPKAIQIMEDQANSLVAQYNLTEVCLSAERHLLSMFPPVPGSPVKLLLPSANGHECTAQSLHLKIFFGVRLLRIAMQTVSEMYIMYATAQCLPCSVDEARDFAVEAAKANALERKAATALQLAEDAVNAARRQLQDATRQ
jgi:hypothetical protein